MNKNLTQFFNLPNENEKPSKEISGGTFDLGNFQKDYELVQSNLKDLIQNGNVALESALKVATESDSPRAFEVVAILLKTMADLNNNVLDVHKKAKATTKDLQNLLNKDRSTEKEVIEAEVVKDVPKQ
jgi:uncharacterized protein with von Willebrand factor type A (vWA) domain